jgi:hypothetical protein
MTNVQLTRIVEPVMVTRNGRGSIENRVKTACVTFNGPDGQEVSIAFDGRADCYCDGSRMLREEYVTYSDCPIIGDNDSQSGSVSDLQVMRILRDELVKMDLGDYDPFVVCDECEDRFVPDNRSGVNYCPDCMNSAYCSVCTRYAVLDDDGHCPDCAGKKLCGACGDYAVLDDNDNCADCARYLASAQM